MINREQLAEDTTELVVKKMKELVLELHDKYPELTAKQLLELSAVASEGYSRLTEEKVKVFDFESC